VELIRDEPRQASGVVGVSVGDDQEVNRERRGGLQDLLQLLGNGVTGWLRREVSWVGAVDEDDLLTELAEDSVAVWLASDVK
jgi:hypothetical protein